MSNCIKYFYQNAKDHPKKMAMVDLDHGPISFEELVGLSSRVQSIIRKYGLGPEDSVLVAVRPSPILFGIITGLIGMGVKIIFIEPWLSIHRINHVIETAKPKIFFTSTLGKIWGARSEQIRKIKHWVTPRNILNEKVSPLYVESVDLNHPSFIAFSSGTTGAPKGAVRTHGYMLDLSRVLMDLQTKKFERPDLVIFPNVALFHLTTGRGAVIAPSKWTERNFKKLASLCEVYRPQSFTSGPGFLKKLIDTKMVDKFQSLEQIVIGGALTDCWIFEEMFKAYPQNEFVHIYGGSEAEPVAITDAKVAVQKSREKNHFQALCLGKKIDQISCKLKDEILWVAGDNVAKEYMGNAQDNVQVKERDEQGVLWHCMGDRIRFDKDQYLWIEGRQNQNKEDFNLEQKIYSDIQSSKSFIHRTAEGKLNLLFEGDDKKYRTIQKKYPQIDQVIKTKIKRDLRHRARLDRKKSLPKFLK